LVEVLHTVVDRLQIVGDMLDDIYSELQWAV
jgi:hypothetical protein